MARTECKLRFRPSSGTLAALGLKAIKASALPTTAYIMLGEKCVRDCSFCAQAASSSAGAGRLSRVTWPEAEERELLEGLKKATTEGSIRRVCVQTVGGRAALEDVCLALAKLKPACSPKTAFSVSFSATAGIEDVGRLLEAGADRVALAIDACSPGLHRKIKKSELERSLDLIEKAAADYPGRISTHMISGMGETDKDLLTLAVRLRRIGVGLGLFAFTPLKGTAMEKHPKPDLASYRRVQLAFWLVKHHGLDEGGMQFDEAGRLIGLTLPSGLPMEAMRRGEPFMTSGCSACNRPYYNESPGTELYNYPVEPTAEEAAKAMGRAAEGLAIRAAEVDG
ncbi:MAG: radical SAM protein [Firmicutes bacterium]|nr:radical SAM protein [Bacillota bacterium]